MKEKAYVYHWFNPETKKHGVMARQFPSAWRFAEHLRQQSQIRRGWLFWKETGDSDDVQRTHKRTPNSF